MKIRPRDAKEIQRAHDVLWGQVMGSTPFLFPVHDRPVAKAALDVLCWVLQDDHSTGFPTTLAHIEEELTRLRFELREIEEDQS